MEVRQHRPRLVSRKQVIEAFKTLRNVGSLDSGDLAQLDEIEQVPMSLEPSSSDLKSFTPTSISIPILAALEPRQAAQTIVTSLLDVVVVAPGTTIADMTLGAMPTGDTVIQVPGSNVPITIGSDPATSPAPVVLLAAPPNPSPNPSPSPAPVPAIIPPSPLSRVPSASSITSVSTSSDAPLSTSTGTSSNLSASETSTELARSVTTPPDPAATDFSGPFRTNATRKGTDGFHSTMGASGNGYRTFTTDYGSGLTTVTEYTRHTTTTTRFGLIATGTATKTIDGFGGTGAGSNTGSWPSSTSASDGGNGGSSGGLSKEQVPAVAGGVVGGVAGLAIIALLIMMLFRWRSNHFKNIHARLADQSERGLGPGTSSSMVQAASTSSTAILPFIRRSRTKSGPSLPATPDTSERGFCNFGGRKLESVLLSGGDGYGGPSASSASPSSTYQSHSSHPPRSAGANPITGYHPSPHPNDHEANVGNLPGRSFFRDSILSTSSRSEAPLAPHSHPDASLSDARPSAPSSLTVNHSLPSEPAVDSPLDSNSDSPYFHPVPANSGLPPAAMRVLPLRVNKSMPSMMPSVPQGHGQGQIQPSLGPPGRLSVTSVETMQSTASADAERDLIFMRPGPARAIVMTPGGSEQSGPSGSGGDWNRLGEQS